MTSYVGITFFPLFLKTFFVHILNSSITFSLSIFTSLSLVFPSVFIRYALIPRPPRALCLFSLFSLSLSSSFNSFSRSSGVRKESQTNFSSLHFSPFLRVNLVFFQRFKILHQALQIRKEGMSSHTLYYILYRRSFLSSIRL